MITVAGIIDQLCILERRIKENRISSRSEEEIAIIGKLLEQRGWLIKELSHILVHIIDNDRPAMFKKYKEYDKNVFTEQNDYLLDSIADLNMYNNKLWDLESIRRNKGYSDEQRLKAADEVAVFNKNRNDTIDAIDELITNALDISLYYQKLTMINLLEILDVEFNFRKCSFTILYNFYIP